MACHDSVRSAIRFTSRSIALRINPEKGSTTSQYSRNFTVAAPSKGLHSRLGASRELPSAAEMKKFQTALGNPYGETREILRD